MIRLTKADKSEFFLNPLLLENIAANPDTVITMSNNKKYVVKDSVEEITEKVVDFWRSVYNLEYKSKLLLELKNDLSSDKDRSN